MYARLSPTWTTHSCASRWYAIVTVVPMPLSSGCSADSSRMRASAWRSAVWNCAEDSLRFGSVRVKEPLERVERELLDGDDGEGAGLFAGAVPSHAIGHEKQVPAFLAELRLRFRQARLPDAHRLGELGAQELIFIGRAHATLVGDAERLHRQRPGFKRHHGLDVRGHVLLNRAEAQRPHHPLLAPR